MKKKNPNAKDTRWEVPVTLPSVKPEEYDTSIESGAGSASSGHRKK